MSVPHMTSGVSVVIGPCAVRGLEVVHRIPSTRSFAQTFRYPSPSQAFIKGNEELVPYGERSRFVTSVRIPHAPGGRPSPDA